MSCKEASPEAIGAIGKYGVVASGQDSQVSALGLRAYIGIICGAKKVTEEKVVLWFIFAWKLSAD